MRNSETGEFELIIGNRMLLSAFFIVVLLFAVAFAMGYVVGQNSPRSAKLAAEAASVSTQPAVSDTRPAPASAAANPQPQQTPAAPAEGTQPPPSDAQAQPQPTTQAPPAEAQAPSPQSAGGNAPAAPAVNYPAPPAAPAGSYWQVIAVAPSDIDVFYKTLKDRGFPTWVEPASTKNLMRVLVGPYKDRESMGKAKDEIEKLGFKPVRK